MRLEIKSNPGSMNQNLVETIDRLDYLITKSIPSDQHIIELYNDIVEGKTRLILFEFV